MRTTVERAAGAAGDDEAALGIDGHRQGIVVLGRAVLAGPDGAPAGAVPADEGVDPARAALTGQNPLGGPDQVGVLNASDRDVPGVVGRAGFELIRPQRRTGRVVLPEEGGGAAAG